MIFLSALLAALTLPSASDAWQPGNLDDGTIIFDNDDSLGPGDRNLLFSKGLMAKAIAIKPPKGASTDGFPEVVPGKGYLHDDVDGGAVFPKKNGKGFYYVSNSEEKPGGVLVIETDLNHDPVDFYRVLGGTDDNCAGGPTPWDTWVSCEEEHPTGYCYQTDPEGKIESQVTAVTAYGGNWEAFAWNDFEYPPRGYTTDDDEPDNGGCDNVMCLNGEEKTGGYCGAIDRYTPSEDFIRKHWKANDKGTSDGKQRRWNLLNDPDATHDYLKLNEDDGTFEWVEDPCDSNPEAYPKGEGIHIEDNVLTFVAKENNQLFFLDLIEMTYEEFEVPQEPDNIRGLGSDTYICTDDGFPNRIYVFDRKTGEYSVVVEEVGYGGTEFAGASFTPDKKFMYFTVQDRAVWVMWREDGRAFNDATESRITV